VLAPDTHQRDHEALKAAVAVFSSGTPRLVVQKILSDCRVPSARTHALFPATC
jgi:hypothetical protein